MGKKSNDAWRRRLATVFGYSDIDAIVKRMKVYKGGQDGYKPLDPQRSYDCTLAESRLSKRLNIAWPDIERFVLNLDDAQSAFSTDLQLEPFVSEGQIPLSVCARLVVVPDFYSQLVQNSQRICAKQMRDKQIHELAVEMADETGTIPVSRIAAHFGTERMTPIIEHQDCAVLLPVTPGEALSLIESGEDALLNLWNRPVSMRQTSADTKLPIYVIRHVIGNDVDSISHSLYDEIVAVSQDAAWRKKVKDEAIAKREQDKQQRERERAQQKEEARVRREKAAEACTKLGLPVVRESVNTNDAVEVLGISASTLRSAIKRGDVKAYQVTGQGRYGQQDFWRIDIFDLLEIVEQQPLWLTKALARKNAPKMVLQPHLPHRDEPPESVVFHVGPTNSGKTHDALDALAEAGQGAYAAPLRMLAAEAYEKLVERVGPELVGLITGEERINEYAPIICCTAEMTPMYGELLVLDEVQWADDRERGWAWTRLMLGATYRHIRIVGAPDALPLVKAAFPQTEISYRDRLCPLEVQEKAFKLDSIPDRSVVVTFSRKAVYHLAGLIQSRGRSTAVIYGAMPPEVRRHEIGRFISGEAQVIVATDVIGHGINLPASTVIFAETQKFDGTRRRTLETWELAQIAGRAGRFGFDTAGTVGVLQGIPGMMPSVDLVMKVNFPLCKVGDGLRGYRFVTHGRLAPTLSDLSVDRTAQLRPHLKAWHEIAVKQVAPWVRLADVSDMISRLNVLCKVSGFNKLDLESAWRLTRSPIDVANGADLMMLGAITRALMNGDSLKAHLSYRADAPIGDLEIVSRKLAILRWFSLAFPDVGGITYRQIVAADNQVNKTIISRLRRAVERGVAKCPRCGSLRAPWFSVCDTCHQVEIAERYADDYY